MKRLQFLIAAASLWTLPLLWGCWDTESPLEPDTNDVVLDTEENKYDPTALTVEGHVSITGSGATDTVVTLRCGDETVETVTDDDGDYSLTADVTGCDSFVLAFVKDSYQPNMRTVALPLYRSPITVDVPLAELEELQCGDHYCKNKFASITTQDVIAHGWIGTKTGRDALAFVPGEFRDTAGTLLYLVGVGDFWLQDREGRDVTKMKTVYACILLQRDALDWLGDDDLTTDEVENRAYRLDTETGRWEKLPLPSLINYKLGDQYKQNEETQKCEYLKDDYGKTLTNWVPVLREDLGNVRAETHYEENPCSTSDPKTQLYITQYAVCMPVDRAGVYAAGIPMTRKSCFNMHVRNPCGKPIRGAAFSFHGRDHGYRAQGWTDVNGDVCLESLGSEPLGEDFDMDGLGGETFWVDAELDPPSGGTVRMNDVETAEAVSGAKGCAAPETCVQLNETIRESTECE